MLNPYDPQNPVKPHYFGGRATIISSFNERLDNALRSKRSGGILIYGHRGVGKTSLLKKFVDIVNGGHSLNNSGVLIIYRRLSTKTNSENLYSILLEELKLKIRERETLIEKTKKIGQSLSGVSAFGLGIDIQQEKANLSSFQVWKLALKSLKEVSCVMIALDDSDELDISALGELKTVMEESTDMPLILTISGGVEFEERLVGDYSPIARIFSGSSFNISKFEYDETKEALLLPLCNEETRWTDDGIKTLHHMTLGYPYLVQCLAKASYRENQEITKDIVKGSVEAAVGIGKAWLGHAIPNASDNDIKFFLKIVEINKEIFLSSEMIAKDILPPYIGRLVKLKVIKKISYGRYKLEQSPIAAIFEKLKRGI